MHVTNFLLPFLKRGNSVVLYAKDGSTLWRHHSTEPHGRSTYELQLLAFSRHVSDVREGWHPAIDQQIA